MIFSSILFLCYFLPLTVGVYYLLPKGARNGFLFAASLLFYAWGEPVYILIMLFSTLFDYTNGRLLERFSYNHKVRRFILVLSLSVNLGLLCFFKYTDLFLTTVNHWTGSALPLLKLPLPIGISFYTFQTLSYTIDVYRGRVKAQHSVLDFGMYVCLFPQLIAGPIVRYADIEKQLGGRTENNALFWSGMLRFSVGLGKKVLLANQIGGLWDEISAAAHVPALTAWLGALAFTFQIYFDFSGYSDMAIGLGQMFGFRFPENFRYPYQSKSITEFWRRWHMTLGTWFREYLYIPLGGNRVGKKRQVFNLLIVWSLTGLWHGASWNFLLWGLFYFVLLAVEKNGLLRRLEALPDVIQHGYTLFFVVIGWVLFACDNVGQFSSFLPKLFGAEGFCSDMSLYYLTTYAPLLVLLCLASTEYPKKLAERLSHYRCYPILQGIFITAITVLSLVFLVGDSYNPFLYFRF